MWQPPFEKMEAISGTVERADGDEVLGRWLDRIEGTALTTTFKIYRQSGALYLSETNSDGSARTLELTETSRNRFEEKRGNRSGEFYLIDGQGDLQLWDSKGFITTARKL